MSTTFGVIVNDHEIEVAFRNSRIVFTNQLAELLPNETEVFPLDNSAQGIYTIGDIKERIKNQDL